MPFKKIVISLAVLACSILPAYSHCNLCFYKTNPAGLTSEELAALPRFCQEYENGASASNSLDTIPSEAIDAFRYYTLKSGHVELFCECDVTSHSKIGNVGKKDTHHLEAQNSIANHGAGFCAHSVQFECSSVVEETPVDPMPNMPGMHH